MAEVTVQRVWPDGETLVVSVEVDESFPDAVAEAKQAAIHAYEGALEVTLARTEEEDVD